MQKCNFKKRSCNNEKHSWAKITVSTEETDADADDPADKDADDIALMECAYEYN